LLALTLAYLKSAIIALIALIKLTGALRGAC